MAAAPDAVTPAKVIDALRDAAAACVDLGLAAALAWRAAVYPNLVGLLAMCTILWAERGSIVGTLGTIFVMVLSVLGATVSARGFEGRCKSASAVATLEWAAGFAMLEYLLAIGHYMELLPRDAPGAAPVIITFASLQVFVFLAAAGLAAPAWLDASFVERHWRACRGTVLVCMGCAALIAVASSCLLPWSRQLVVISQFAEWSLVSWAGSYIVLSAANDQWRTDAASAGLRGAAHFVTFGLPCFLLVKFARSYDSAPGDTVDELTYYAWKSGVWLFHVARDRRHRAVLCCRAIRFPASQCGAVRWTEHEVKKRLSGVSYYWRLLSCADCINPFFVSF